MHAGATWTWLDTSSSQQSNERENKDLKTKLLLFRGPVFQALASIPRRVGNARPPLIFAGERPPTFSLRHKLCQATEIWTGFFMKSASIPLHRNTFQAEIIRIAHEKADSRSNLAYKLQAKYIENCTKVKPKIGEKPTLDAIVSVRLGHLNIRGCSSLQSNERNNRKLTAIYHK